jgi:hypothetical protein
MEKDESEGISSIQVPLIQDDGWWVLAMTTNCIQRPDWAKSDAVGF